jgi:hypothetical protein
MRWLLFLSIMLLLASCSSRKAAGLKYIDEAKLAQYQDSLQALESQLFKVKTDAKRFEINNKFLALFGEVLQYQNSFSFPFDSLKGVGRLTSPDKHFRIINWNVPHDDGTHEYFGFMQVYSKKDKGYKLFPLIDRSAEIQNPQNAVGDNEKWYGMLYYKIIETKYKKRTYYTLLGWDGNDKISKKKIIDAVSFGPDGTPKFGDGIFNYDKKFPKRVIFEYAADGAMTLNYGEATKNYDDDDLKDLDAKMIVLSHLVPLHPSLEGQYQFYVSDGSFDGFFFKEGKWEYIKDVDARNPKDPKDSKYNVPDNMSLPPR